MKKQLKKTGKLTPVTHTLKDEIPKEMSQFCSSSEIPRDTQISQIHKFISGTVKLGYNELGC